MYSVEKAAGSAWEGEVGGARGPRKRRGEGRNARKRERGVRNAGAKQKEGGLGRDHRRDAGGAAEHEEDLVALWENMDLGTPVKTPEAPRVTPARPTPSGGSRAPALTAAAVVFFAALMFMVARNFGLLKLGGPPVPKVSGEPGKPLDFKLEDALQANLQGAPRGGDDATGGEGGQGDTPTPDSPDVVDYIGSLFGSLDEDEGAESGGEEDDGDQPQPSGQPEPVPSGADEGEQGPLDVGEGRLSAFESLKNLAELVAGGPSEHSGRSASLSDIGAGGVGGRPETRPRRSSAPGLVSFEGRGQGGMASEGRGQEGVAPEGRGQEGMAAEGGGEEGLAAEGGGEEGLAPEAPPLPQGGEQEPEPSSPEPTPQEPITPPAPSEGRPPSPSKTPPPKPPRSKLLGYRVTPDTVDIGSLSASRRDSTKRKTPSSQAATLPSEVTDEGVKQSSQPLRRRASAPPSKAPAPTEHRATPPKKRVDVPFTSDEPSSALAESRGDRDQQGGGSSQSDPWVPRSRSNSLGDTVPSPSPDPLPSSGGGGGRSRLPGPLRTPRVRPALPWQQGPAGSGGAEPVKKGPKTPSWLHTSPYSVGFGVPKPGDAAGDADKGTQQQSSKGKKGKKRRGANTM